MRSRIAEETLLKEKTLYENKYTMIVQTLEENRERYLEAIGKGNMVDELRLNNEQLRQLAEVLANKYND